MEGEAVTCVGNQGVHQGLQEVSVVSILIYQTFARTDYRSIFVQQPRWIPTQKPLEPLELLGWLGWLEWMTLHH